MAVLQAANWLNGTAIANATRGSGHGTAALLSMAWQLRGGTCVVKPGAWATSAGIEAAWARWSLGCNASLATDQVHLLHAHRTGSHLTGQVARPPPVACTWSKQRIASAVDVPVHAYRNYLHRQCPSWRAAKTGRYAGHAVVAPFVRHSGRARQAPQRQPGSGHSMRQAALWPPGRCCAGEGAGRLDWQDAICIW